MKKLLNGHFTFTFLSEFGKKQMQLLQSFVCNCVNFSNMNFLRSKLSEVIFRSKVSGVNLLKSKGVDCLFFD